MTWLFASFSCNIPGSFLRQTSPDIASSEDFDMDIWQSWQFGWRTPRSVTVHKQISLDPVTANLGTVGHPCTWQQYATAFILSRTYMLAVTYSNVTSIQLYIPQYFPLLFVIVFHSYSTPAQHGDTYNSPRWQRIQIEPIEGPFI